MNKNSKIAPVPFESLLPKISILENFKIIEKLGQGSFGSIYYAYLRKVNNKRKNFPIHYAIKIEMFDPNNAISLSNRTLSREAKFLYTLKETTGFPRIFYCSTFQDRTILIMDKLGENLETVFNRCHRVFNLQTVILIAEKALTRLETLSQKGIVHRDLKPDNFMLGSIDKDREIYLIDFGLSKKFLNEKNEHIEFQKGVGLVGTPRYTSINSHLGHQQSRRDDLESFGYILIYLLKGKLPWMNINYQKKSNDQMITSEMKNNIILKIKQDTNLEELCSDLPLEFLEYFKYVKELKFNEAPDYQLLIRKFKGLFKDSKENYEFEWENNKVNTKKSSEPHVKTLSTTTKSNNSENLKKMHFSNMNMGNAQMNWQNSKKTSGIPKKSNFMLKNDELQNKSSFEAKINANFLNDVSIQDEELAINIQKTISRKIIFQPLRNGRANCVKLNCSEENLESNFENIEQEEDDQRQNLGCLMKFLGTQQVFFYNFSFSLIFFIRNREI